MPRKQHDKDTVTDANAHGIACSCPRCVGLRRYPQPSMCDWCGTVHAGDAANCSENNVDNSGNGVHNDSRDPGDWHPDPFVDGVVDMVTAELKKLKARIKQSVREDGMLSAQEILKRQAASGEGGALLHGSDVPKNIKSFSVTVTGVREAPANFNAAIILDIKEIHGCTAFAVNKTNLKALADKFGDDLDKLKGKSFKLDVVLANNPTTKQNTRGLRVAL